MISADTAEQRSHLPMLADPVSPWPQRYEVAPSIFPVWNGMSLRVVDWIWRIRGSVPLESNAPNSEVLDRLEPLLHEYGTTYERTDDQLAFRKKDQPAQDKLSVFDSGVLQIERDTTGPVLRYQLNSRALLFCFFLPFFFLAIAQLTIAVGKLQGPSAEATAKSGKAADPSKKRAEEQKALPMNPIDKALGAPEPEKPKHGKDKSEEKDKKPSPTAAYVFAAIFATLYLFGRVLEDKLVNVLLKKRIQY